MTYKELLEQLSNLGADELEQDVAIVSYNVNDGMSTTEVQLGDFETDELFIGAWFEKEDKVKDRFVEIYPHNHSGNKYGEDYFKTYEDYNACMEWFKEGNEIVVVLDTETNRQAVYERLGQVYCLDDHWGIYCNVDVDDEYGDLNGQIRTMLFYEAVNAGFPDKCPCRLKEYEVVLRRTARISVMAADPEQAQRIGERLATGETEFACMVANNTLAVGDDEFWGVSAAGNGFCHARLDEEDSMRVLNEEE